tara:strand:+ start:2337 stop:3047 length:711 start_codon:yes stop_codon:yes gene_type:complete
MDNVELVVTRYDPEIDDFHRSQTFSVRAVPGMTVLDALVQVRDEQDGSLRFRESEPGGWSGSCAVTVNDVPCLASRTLLARVILNNSAVIGPLKNFPVICDLVVDNPIYLAKIEALEPWVDNAKEQPASMTREEYFRLRRTDGCALCGICDANSDEYLTDPMFIGAASLLWTYRLTSDSRDSFDRERMEAVLGSGGLWAFSGDTSSEDLCPYAIDPVNQIMRLRNAASQNGYVPTE